MSRTSFRRAAAPGVVAIALGLGLSACTPPNEAASGDESGGFSGTLNGAGATSQEAAMAAWQAGFQSSSPEVTINYDPVGSGGGREQFIAGGTAFGGSDAYLEEEELTEATERCQGEAPIEVPSYVSPIAIIYNLEGVDDLQLSAEAIAGIFNDEINAWDDPAIAEDNPDVELPDARITAVHRSDDSGTTENFVDYLAEAAPDAWPHEVSGVWPINAGEAAQGNSGVVAAVDNGSGTIGYVDASQAGDLRVASVQVGGEYVGPTPEAAARVVEVSDRVEGRPETSMAVELDRSTAEQGVYPIVLLSYMIACPAYSDANTGELVNGFLSYVVGDEGQQASAETAGSAPLPDSLQDEALGYIEQIGQNR